MITITSVYALGPHKPNAGGEPQQTADSNPSPQSSLGEG